ncbi:uncharacterized protein BKCO1_8900018 [Diplodia corticola]|uniref:Uncharacterized protein n=1 Tax=Diplodia corticola TaxID=236234 RepID=A0A1J9RNJ8_9PEZI|nr:uncharacterized protein BKCO1_8900018 [Diplodia corticola]OJD29165.1 hypothetical protein BKCO1_8900018 [Diplodia corticola]
MHRLPRQQDDGALNSPRSSRAPSISSDRQSTAGSTSTIAAVYVPSAAFQPPPAYVAVSAASQIVTDHQNATLLDQLTPEEADNVPAESALCSEVALGLLNGFLDSLLFSVLATGRSRSLTTIRPAVQEVLKPRLAREAMKAADEELSGLLAGDDDEEELPSGNDVKWNLEAVFKRTRLRIMVYTRLGELEDEDEERFLEEDEVYAEDEEARDAGLVSWAAAIFLTSVIEYIAEQTLIVAGQAAFKRVRTKRRRATQTSVTNETELEELERTIVHDFDMEKVALNSALGRLWRTWKKTNRAPTTPITATGRSSLFSSSFSFNGQRRYSTGNAHDAPSAAALAEVPEVEYSERDIASNIPLPMGKNDVDEIEVPGLAETYEEVDESATPPRKNKKQRPMSWLAAPGSGRHLIRSRSSSMPTLKQLAERHASVTSEETLGGTPPFQTPAESFNQREDYIAEGEQIAEANQTQNSTEKDQTAEVKESFDERDREEVSSIIAETGSLPGAASPPSAPPLNRRSILRDRSPKPLQLGRDILANAKPTDSNRANKQRVENKVEIKPKPFKANSAAKGSREDKSVKPTTSSDVPGLAMTTDVAKSGPPSPLPAGIDDAVPREKRPANRLSVFPPPAKNHVSPSTEALPTREPVPKDASKEPFPSGPVNEESKLKQTPSMEWTRDTDSGANNRVSRALRSQTVSTQASQTVPQGPPSISALSTQTRDSSTSRRSHDSLRGRATAAEFGVERAGLQRVSSISSAGTSILHTSRGSESSIPTAGATRRPAGNSRKSEDDRARDFDAAIAQADTVYYTLTPERMREVSKERERKARAEAEARDQATHARSAAAAQVSVFPRGPHSGSGSSQQLQRSNSSSRGSVSSKQGKSTISDDSAKEAKASRPTPINQVGNIYTRNKYMPREPRVQTDPTFDLRDFLISTTPSSNDKNVVPLDTSFSRSADNSPATTTPTGARALLSKTNSRSRTSSRSGKNSFSEGSSLSLATRRKLEARSPAGPVHVDNDLIDLIRQGPPGSDHRIPRTVAPFRDTMDSEQMELYSNSGVAPSVHSQTTSNSRSALLSKQNMGQPAYDNDPSFLSGGFPDGPAVTKNRPKKRFDPYAIPDDDELEEEFEEQFGDDFDEVDDELTALPGSTGGPVSTPPSGLASENSTAPESSAPQQKAKTATSELADFFASEPPTRAAAEAPVQPFVLSESTLKAIKGGGSATAASANGVRAASSHGNTSSNPGGGVGIPASHHTADVSGGNSRLGTSASNGSFGSGMAKRSNTLRQTGARGARMGESEERGGLSEMADFLKNSGPPPAMDEKPLPFVKFGKDGNPIEPGQKEKSRGISRFWKR